jgi:hypothetical protein
MTIPKGNAMRLTTCQNANQYHDLVTGSSMSGILNYVNQTPISWFSEKQKMVEVTTNGSVFMVVRQACKQIMALCDTLCMMGSSLDGPN